MGECSWELETKMLKTVYDGLALRPTLKSLTLRFPSQRIARPVVRIPSMPNLEYLKVTDIDPLGHLLSSPSWPKASGSAHALQSAHARRVEAVCKLTYLLRQVCGGERQIVS